MLIIGGSGFLGLNWQNYNDLYEIIATYNSHLPDLRAKWVKFTYDGSNISELERLINRTNPKVIVNCAAITNVDYCDKNKNFSQLINTKFPRELAILARKNSLKFVHISTDHYKSEVDLPRKEIDELIPINTYGKTKLAAEKFIIQECPEALVIRVNFFGHSSSRNPSLLDKILLSLSAGQKFYGFKDVHFNPISTKVLVESVHKLIKEDLSGIFHLASSDVISKFEFAKKVCEVFNYSSDFIIESRSDFFNPITNRPKYLALNSDKFTRLTGINNLSINNMLIDLNSDTIWRQQVGAINV
jgi:dTDP-4-dehydrorhamnose reductase